MTNKNYIYLETRPVADECRVNPLFDNACVCFNDMMQRIIDRWYENLTDDVKAALRLINYNRAVINSMMFFSNGTLEEKPNYFICDYNDFAIEMENFAINIANYDDDYEKSQTFPRSLTWYSRMAYYIRVYRNRVNRLKEQHELTLSLLGGDLREQVIYKIISSDPMCQDCCKTYYAELDQARKQMLDMAIAKMKV